MLFSLTSALRSLFGSFRTSDHPRYLGARVKKVLALKSHRQGRVDGLELKGLKTTLQVEWIAREVHPWDRNRPPMSVQKLYTLQCLQDTHTAIEGLFNEIPEVEALDIRIFSAPSQSVVIAGLVHREDLTHAVFDSPAMNLKTLGVSFRMSNWRLEPLAAVQEHAEIKRARG